jgi:hypothetical protein
MSSLRKTILKHLLIERTIGNMSANINSEIYLEIDRAQHSWDRRTRPDLEGKGKDLTGKYSYDYNQREITNFEIREILSKAKNTIAEKIVSHEITKDNRFVVKSLKWEIAIAINPVQNDVLDWTLNVVTVFRESKENPFRVPGWQTVIWV